MSESIRQKLAEICSSYIVEASIPEGIEEPYIPYIPDEWNGILVLAEAQNLSDSNTNYVNNLRQLDQVERIRRLGFWSDMIGVAPWDDGTLKLAVEASCGIDVNTTAISNAVMRSSVSRSGSNANPGSGQKREALILWTKMLGILKPNTIITAGAVARDIMRKAIHDSAVNSRHFVWALPSPRVLNPIEMMIGEEELKLRFKEVAIVIKRKPEYMNGEIDRRKILYACLAVASVRSQTV